METTMKLNSQHSEKLVVLSDLFDVVNGIASSEVKRYSHKIDDSCIPYVRPSYRQETSIDAFVSKYEIDTEYVFPKDTLYVSTDGQGSHTYSYVSTSEFVPNSNVSVLIPKRPMTLSEKLFYAHCISINRYKFSYGRKPKGERLKAIKLPNAAPNSVSDKSIQKYQRRLLNSFSFVAQKRESKSKGTLVALSDLFDIVNGISSPSVTLYAAKQDDSFIPFLRPSYRQMTSITGFVKKSEIEERFVFPKETLYVSTNGQGSHTYSYVSSTDFVPNSDVTVLIPKKPMTLSEKLFYAHCISINRYKFSYGRKPKGDRLKAIILPDAAPDFITDNSISKIISKLSQDN